MRRKSRETADARIDGLASEVERLLDGANMFRVIHKMTRKPVAKRATALARGSSNELIETPHLVQVLPLTNSLHKRMSWRNENN